MTFRLLLCLAIGVWLSARNVNASEPRDAEMNRFIDSLMAQMTPEEKVGQTNLLAWDGSLQTGARKSSAVREKIARGVVGGMFNVESRQERIEIQKYALQHSRHKIPLLFGQDVIHGHRTIFPIPLGLSCSWNMELIERTARAAAEEASADGIDWVFSPMVDLVRDPRWGRVAESSGEDPYLGSCIAEAMVKGYQSNELARPNSVMACVKHFGLYGAGEGGRDYDAVDMSLNRMYQVYLPPYRAAVRAGVGSIMTSFNDINGVPATANKWLLSDLLRDQWGFEGLTVSDYTAVGELSNHGLGTLQQVAARALDAGLDMDMVSEGIYRHLDPLLKAGAVSMHDIDRACRNVLIAKYRLGLFDDPFIRLREQETNRAQTMRLALEAARESIVLLKNENRTLPLEKNARIALIGPFADNKSDLFGTWVLSGNPDEVVTVKEGIARYTSHLTHAPGAVVTDNPNLARMLRYDIQAHGDPEKLLNDALEAVRNADIIVAVMGETSGMSGESASMTDIGLQKTQKQLLEALVKTGKDVVLVLINGRPMTLEWENEHCKAILEAWAPGIQGGNAIADILFGVYNPSGRLSMSFPVHVGQIPVYYASKPTGRPHVPFGKYTNGYIDCVNAPLYPFGYGLSYSPVGYSDLQVSQESHPGHCRVRATVTNRGEYPVLETVQLYIGDPVASVSRPKKELKAFQKVALAPGESKEVEFQITENELKFYNEQLEYDWEPGIFRFEVGPDSQNTLSYPIRITKPDTPSESNHMPENR